MRKCLCLLMILLLLPGCALAGRNEKVYLEGETEPFPEDAVLLTLRVCPLMGAESMLITLGEHSMLVDAGLYDNYHLVRQMLQEAGLSELEFVYNSHPHDDHIGGVRGWWRMDSPSARSSRYFLMIMCPPLCSRPASCICWSGKTYLSRT